MVRDRVLAKGETVAAEGVLAKALVQKALGQQRHTDAALHADFDAAGIVYKYIVPPPGEADHARTRRMDSPVRGGLIPKGEMWHSYSTSWTYVHHHVHGKDKE
mmetsp:Transcript_21971/g.51101  ORF Transcript_21971/g.51101 Transcript_21971/m.51101 type:complete len:103 (+) Transcript_21971:475-783(+)